MKTVTMLFSLTLLIRFSPEAGAQPPPGARPSPWSVGALVITDSQPYTDADGIVRVLPSVVYRGERLEVLGPLVRYRLFRNEWWDVHAIGAVEFSPYEEDDSPVLNGLDEPDPTLIAGVTGRFSLEPLLGKPLSLTVSTEGDVLGEHGGYQATFGASYRLGSPRQTFSGGLGAGVLLQDENWTNYFVEVPLARQTETRPAYEASSSVNPYLALRVMIRFNRNWSLMGLARLEWLDDSYTDSPLVSDDTRTITFVGLNYSF
jgi:outer membrane protein